MSDPYRAPESRAEGDEPIPDFGNRPKPKLVELAQAFVISVLFGVGMWLDAHDVGLALVLSAPIFLVVASILLLDAPVREWRARRRARVNIAEAAALEAAVAEEPAVDGARVRIAADVAERRQAMAAPHQDTDPGDQREEDEEEVDEDQPARRSRSTRGS